MSQEVTPQSIEKLQQILQDSGHTGHSIYVYRQSSPEGITVNLAKLDKVIEIDEANLVATVEPGVKLGVLAELLVKKGLRFLPGDTPFYHDKTVGQFFYEGCANLSSVKYGSTKHFLLGSEVVLPTGELLKTGGKTVKNVTGYDFTRFFNAPYADLGITVKFLLKLLPLPETRKGIAVSFKSIKNMLAFISALKENRIVPAYLLWVDQNVQRIFQQDLDGQLLLLECDGLEEETDELCKNIGVIIKKYGGSICESYEGLGKTAVKWKALYSSLDKYILTDEYKMPFTCQGEFIEEFYELVKSNSVRVGLFGQAAEGKLHLAFATAAADDAFISQVTALVKKVGGNSAGKYERLAGKCASGILAELEQQAKAAFDPQQILNRLKVQKVK